MTDHNNFHNMQDLLSSSGWTVLKYNEDAYRKSGVAPRGVARMHKSEQIVLLILGERLIGTFSFLNYSKSLKIEQLADIYSLPRDSYLQHKAYLIDSKFPFTYLLIDDILWAINRISSDSPYISKNVLSPEDVFLQIKSLSGNHRTLLYPIERKFIRPSTCKCRSGWVSTKHGGVFDASDSICRDCRELGSYEFSQINW